MVRSAYRKLVLEGSASTPIQEGDVTAAIREASQAALGVGAADSIATSLPGTLTTLRTDRTARHRFEKVNSSHHQAIDKLGDGLVVEAWSAQDDIVEQVRLCDYPYALGVQYHPERGKIYDALFGDFFARLMPKGKCRQD